MPGRLLGVVLGLLLLGHAVQFGSPLRLNTDAIRLLHMAGEHARTGVFPDEQFPPAYPWIISTMARASLGSTFWLVALNHLALAIGCLVLARAALRRTPGDSTGALLLLAIPLASWVTIKHAPIPLTEPLYLAFSLSCILAAERAARHTERTSAGLWWALAFALAILATLTRTIGVALLIALTASMLPGLLRGLCNRVHHGKLSHANTAKLVLVLFIPATCLAWLLIVQLSQPGSYLNNGIAYFQNHGWTDWLRPVAHRGEEFAQLALNLPAGILPAATHPILPWAGLALLTGLAALLRHHLRQPSVALRYVATYLAILFLWPYPDPRFWLPLLPVLVWLVITSPRPLATERVQRRLAAGWLVLYLLLGLVALGHNSQLAFHSDSFATRYTRDQTLRATYHHAFGQPDPHPHDPLALKLLRQYEPLARDHIPPSGP